jgi:hypothetical protein
METATKLPTLYIPTDALTLPDSDQWQFRFEIHSETSDRVYVIAQNKRKKHWACSCPGWKRNRKCKHLSAIGVPNYEQPYEVLVK